MRLSHPLKLLAVFFASAILIVLNFRFIHSPAVSLPDSNTARQEQVALAEIVLAEPERTTAEESTSIQGAAPGVAPDEPQPAANEVELSPAVPLPQAAQPEPAAVEPEPSAVVPEPVIDEPALVIAGMEPEDVEAADLFSEAEPADIASDFEVGAPATGFGLLDPAIADQQQTQVITPGLDQFILQAGNGSAEEVRGVYVEGIMALPIVQQPENDVGFVSMEDGTATLFQSPLMHGIVGLLAHNFLSGNLFFKLNPGMEIVLVYGSGRLRRFQVAKIANYERLTRSNLRSNFVELETGITLTADEVFERFYKGDHHLTLQTCIERDGIWNWGVRFIVAEPIDP